MTIDPYADVTDYQIETLRAEATAAGDNVQAALCVLALHLASEYEDLQVRRPLALTDTQWADATVAEARAECERVIRDARAQRDL